MHEATFRKTVQAAGLNPYMLEIANIREQCSWIHKDIKEATEKAIIFRPFRNRKKFSLNAPLTSQTSPVVKRALVNRRRYRWYPDCTGYCRCWF